MPLTACQLWRISQARHVLGDDIKDPVAGLHGIALSSDKADSETHLLAHPAQVRTADH